MNNFYEEVRNAVAEEMGNGYEVKLIDVPKNNNVVLKGIVILEEGNRVSPTMYVQENMTVGKAARKVINSYHLNKDAINPDKIHFDDFNMVKDNIIFCVVNTEMNKELLSNIPHKDILDFSLIYKILYFFDDEVGTVTVNDKLLNMWKTDVETLDTLAQANTPRLLPFKQLSMGDMMPFCLLENTIRILTNDKQLNGAGVMFYPGVLEQMAEEYGDLIILPSNIHETIAIPESFSEGSLEAYSEMVKQVNALELKPQEILSDHAYAYRNGVLVSI